MGWGGRETGAAMFGAAAAAAASGLARGRYVRGGASLVRGVWCGRPAWGAAAGGGDGVEGVSGGGASSAGTPGKDTTGLVGLYVDDEARVKLIGAYEATLESLKGIPKEARYRQNLEKTLAWRLEACRDPALSDKDVEEKVGMGQVEQLLREAQVELSLTEFMKVHKPWEVDAGATIETDFPGTDEAAAHEAAK